MLNFENINTPLESAVFALLFFLFFGIIAGIIYILYVRRNVGTLIDSKTEDLLKSRDFFLRLFDDSPVPYLMVDKEGVVVLPNKAAKRLFQMSSDELREYKFFQLHEQDHFVQSRTIYDKFIRGVATSDAEIEIVRKDGVKRWVKLSALPYRVKEGENKGGTITMLDITDQKAVDRVKTEFVSLASHQLRTPLTAIKWYGEMVLDGKEPLTEKQKKYIGKIYDGNQRMIDLVELLLSASRLELGSMHIDIENIDPTKLVKQTLEEVSQSISKKKLHIIESYSGDNTNFYTDEKLIHMIIQNLLTNAVKYSNENGEVKITLAFTNENMTIEVQDSGMGIPLQQQDKIFTKMFRADNARSKVTDGTGLGLYIVKEAVETLGGEIGFTSEENHGTMFTAVIPNGTHGSNKVK